MATPASIPLDPNRDSAVRLHRQTREHRHLWYQLTVLQQPERARACGAGTKANSDRRPVDPPPVVELRIKEGSSWEEGKEITFDYNASFFLYASLEQHRKIAPGRMQSQPNPPILTGVPASGMAYLDRPAAAGYFIFPDLSVRHEGQYRLSFSLFETTKEEKDYDLEPADGNLPTGVDWRMEIKTAPFDVFSAKKFPGLMESTPLSKEVADQGCRVRIRRDVRMRKRDPKSGGHDRREEGYSRRRNVTPATEDRNAVVARARSISNSSEQRVPYASDVPRRPSIVDAYHPGPPPPPPQSSYDPASRGHLSFGDHPAPPSRQYSQPPLAPISSSGTYTPGSHYVKQEPHSYPYAPPSRGGPPPPVSPALRQHESQDRRSTYVPPSPVYSTTSSHANHARHEPHASIPSTPISSLIQPPRPESQPAMSNSMQLPSIKPNAPSGSMAISAILGSPKQQSNVLPPFRPLQPAPIEPDTELRPLLPPPTNAGSKRKHDNTFDQNTRPLHNGERQVDPHHRGQKDRVSGLYTRADGTMEFVTFNHYYFA
jgi:hypothetical protein